MSVAGAFCSGSVDFYVAPDGNDSWSGKSVKPASDGSAGPFATLERARDEIRRLKAGGALQGQVTVFVRGGTYSMKNTLLLNESDSGMSGMPIVYRAYKNEKPVLIGGKQITGFSTHKGSILKADAGSQGFKNIYFRQLIFDGKRQHLARYPNYDSENPYGGGWAYVEGKWVELYREIPGEVNNAFTCKQENFREWSRPEEMDVFVFPRYNWWNNICRVKSINRETRLISLANHASYAIRPGDRYYFRNALEELDVPGEWYLDKQTWTLYFWPPASMEGRVVCAPTMRTILEMRNAGDVTFRGMTFECCEGTAVSLNNTTNCLVAGCTVRNVGDYNGSGVSINGGTKNSVVGCDIFETGSNGISIGGGDRKTLTSAENFADNNYIHHVGVFYKQGVGVSLHGVGNRASHNLIHDGPRMGIMFSGNNLVIEYNHIRHMNLETSDTGAVYTGGRDWISSRGTVIRYNYFHDMLGYGQNKDGDWVSPFYAWGIYLDDNTGGVDVFGNIVARCSRASIHLHNGRDNLVENNIFVEGKLQQIECNGWTDHHSYWTNHLQTMIKGYEMVYDQPAWKNMRNMNLHPTNAVLPDHTIMAGNKVFRNIVYYNDPKAKYPGVRNFSFAHNEWDSNIVWHAGQPLLTGQKQFGKTLSSNLLSNAGFEEGVPGVMPRQWQWQICPTKEAKAVIVEDGAAEGKRCLCINAAFAKEKKRDNYPIVVSKDFSLEQGRWYRLAARLKAAKSEAKAGLMVQSYIANVYFWANWPREVKVGTEWKEYQFTFKVPGQGDKDYNEKMKAFRVRLDFPEEDGRLFVDGVLLTEVEMLDEWASWQALGMDRHSLEADPRFADPGKDDYRLKWRSPAFKLGFKQIPVDEIGPYKDGLRASWPIVEAEGAREKPL